MAALDAIVHAARVFLESRWPAWHRRWGPPHPACASQWTCIRSSLFVRKVLGQVGIGATIASGVPNARERCGFFDGVSWNSHAWVRTAGAIVDVTADQFSAADVIITPISDSRYRAGLEPDARLSAGQSAIAAVDAIWPDWIEETGSARYSALQIRPGTARRRR
jgi:hypothetical protein